METAPQLKSGKQKGGKRGQARSETYQGREPELDECVELVEYLYEIGPYETGPMGLQPISWSEMDAWQRTTGIRLDPWEAKQVRKLSFVYLDQHHKAEDPTCPCPWVDELHVDHKALGDRIKNQFRQFNQSRKGIRRV